MAYIQTSVRGEPHVFHHVQHIDHVQMPRTLLLLMHTGIAVINRATGSERAATDLFLLALAGGDALTLARRALVVLLLGNRLCGDSSLG